MTRRIVFFSLLLLVASSGSGKPLPGIRLSGPPVMESLPLLVMAEAEAPVSGDFTAAFTPWHTPDQLRAMIAGHQVDAAIVTTTTACTFYNKGVESRVLLFFEAPLWIVSAEPGPETLESLNGILLLPFGPGEMPELLCRAVMNQKNGRLAIRHTGGAMEALNLLLAGRGDHILLSEPTASIALLRSNRKPTAPLLTRRVDLRKVWAGKFSGQRLAANCIARFGPRSDNPLPPDRSFYDAYAQACRWVVQNPEKALAIARRRYPALAAQLETGIVEMTGFRLIPRQQSRREGRLFLEKMMKISPAVIGGAMPEDGFFKGFQ